MARRAETYDALFELSDGACAVVRARALELLRLLPTRGDVRDELKALLGAPNGARDAKPPDENENENENERSVSFSAEEARSRRERLRALLSSSPSRGAYALQALDGLLTPPDVSADALREAAAESAETGNARVDDDEIPADPAGKEEDAREAETAEEARAFRAAFARLGFARDALALLPRGADSSDASLEDASSVDVASARVAWRDPELRRATCASALSVLSVSLADADSIEFEFDRIAADRIAAETGTEEVLLARDDVVMETKQKTTEEEVASESFAAFAADAAPSLATLARVFSFSDETGSDESGESRTGNENENDEILATTAVRLFFKCARARASFEREDVVAASLLKMKCFPATLRDVLTRARASDVRRAFALNTLRAALWIPPTSNASVFCVSSAHDSLEKREKEKKRGGGGSFRPPPGFADVALAALDDAEARPERCREYFQVLSALLGRRDEDDKRCLDDGDGGNEEELEANAKLDVAASALFARETEALRVAPREMDKEEEPDPRLLSRLETMLTLLDRLDRRRAAPAARAEVDAAVTRLARTLLYRCLFPEAAPLLRPAEATLRDAGVELCGGAAEEEGATREGSDDGAEDDPEDASFAARFGLRVADLRVTEAHLAPACATPATRRAAFALLARLAARRVTSEDFAAAAAARDAARAGETFAGEAASLAAPCGEEILDTVAALHHSGAIDSFPFLRSDFSSRDFAARPAHGYVGLKNAGATCYMNAVFQQMFAVPRLRDAILAAPVGPRRSSEGDVSDSVFHQLRATFAALALSRLDHFAPRGFWRAFKDYDGEPINVREHQDGLEFFGRLQDQVDAEYKKAVAAAAPVISNVADAPVPSPLPVKGAVEAAMGGVFVNQVISKSCPHRSERVEDFVHVSVEVRGKKGLEESLASYVSGELLEADNQWSCEACGAKRDAVKRSCFRGDALPATLCLHLKRFEFDYETMQRHKIKSRFEFPETLDMAPFTVEALEKRSDGLPKTDENAAEEDVAEKKEKKIEYRLAGVVVHSGTAFAGHYYSYIRERAPPPGIAVDLGDEPDVGRRWHAFDDQRVEPYDVSNLEADAFGGTYQVDASTLRAVDAEDDDLSPRAGRKRFDRPNSAYMLFYDRVEPKESSPSKTSPPKTRLPPAIPAMPASVRRAVMAKNLRFAFESNARDREYFAFVDALVRALVAGGGREKLLAGAAPSGDRRRRRSNGAGESRAKKAARVREADTPGGDDALDKTQTPSFARSPATPPTSRADEEAETETETETPASPPSARNARLKNQKLVSSTRPVDAFRAELAARFAVEFLCRAFPQTHARTASDAESLRRWRDAVTALVRASAPARLWVLRWARAHPGVIEAFLGAPGPTAETRDAIAAILAAAVRGDDVSDADAEEEASVVADDFFDDFVTKSSSSAISRAADFVARDVARAAGAARDAEGDGADAPVSAWYFRVLAAYARAETAVLGDGEAFLAFFGQGGTYARIERLSRLELLEPLVACARALGTRAGRRRELGHPAKLPRRLGGFKDEDADAHVVGARTRHETVSAVWTLVSAMLRACDTTQARRVFARRCASRAAKALGLAAPGGFRVGAGFRVRDLESDAHSNHETLVPGALLVFHEFEDEDEETLARIEAEAPSPYGLDLRRRTNGANEPRPTRVPLTLGAFQSLFDFAFLHALAKTAAEPGWHVAGVGARVALCHLCWRWETVSYAVALCVLERLDKAEHPEDVAGALRVCEALLRMNDSLAPTRCGFVLEGRTFRHPHAPPNESAPRDNAHGAVAPYLHLAISTATDRRPEDFPSGVIEQAAFEVCAAPKRLLVARFLVRLAEEESAVGARTVLSLEEQREDFGYVVGALGDEAEDADPVDVPREAEEEPPGAFSFSGFGTGGDVRSERGSERAPAPYDETLDDPLTVLARAEAALGRAQAEHDDAEPA